MTDLTTNIGSSIAEAPRGSAASAQYSEDYNAFLQLLTAQISNQDPLSPMDSTQFVDQLATLSQVEQSIETNIQLEAMAAKFATMGTLTGTSLLGRDVMVSSDQVVLEDGKIDSLYILPEGASVLEVDIVDPTGTVIRKLRNLSTDVDKQIPLEWDGLTDAGGRALEGVYTVRLLATTSNGDTAPVESYRRAQVEEVLLDKGNVYVDIGAGEIKSQEDLLSVR